MNPQNAATMARVGPEMKRDCYVNCWHANEAESEAMWRLYCPGRRGVAIQTTYEKLDASLPATVLLGRVTYIDYETRMVTEAMINGLSRLMHKRLAFEHEREIRALIWRSAKLLADDVTLEAWPSDEPPATGVPWDLSAVVERVFVTPYAEEWYRDVVMQVILRFVPALADRLFWSQMKGIPLY